MLPQTFAADTCFLDVLQVCHTGKIVSSNKVCFYLTVETYFTAGNTVSHVAKRGTAGKPCVRSRCFWQHVSSFSRGSIYTSAIHQVLYYTKLGFCNKKIVKRSHRQLYRSVVCDWYTFSEQSEFLATGFVELACIVFRRGL